MKAENISPAIKYAEELDKKWSSQSIVNKTLAKLTKILTARVTQSDDTHEAKENLDKFIAAMKIIEEAFRGGEK